MKLAIQEIPVIRQGTQQVNFTKQQTTCSVFSFFFSIYIQFTYIIYSLLKLVLNSLHFLPTLFKTFSWNLLIQIIRQLNKLKVRMQNEKSCEERYALFNKKNIGILTFVSAHILSHLSSFTSWQVLMLIGIKDRPKTPR